MKPGFKLVGNLDFNLDKTMFLGKVTTTSSQVYDRTQFQSFLQNDPSLQDIEQDFTLNVFAVEGIKVLGTPLGTDTYIKTYVTQNCLKIIRDVEKHDLLTEAMCAVVVSKTSCKDRNHRILPGVIAPHQVFFFF